MITFLKENKKLKFKKGHSVKFYVSKDLTLQFDSKQGLHLNLGPNIKRKADFDKITKDIHRNCFKFHIYLIDFYIFIGYRDYF